MNKLRWDLLVLVGRGIGIILTPFILVYLFLKWLVMSSDPYEGWVTEHTIEYLEAYEAIDEAKKRISEEK